MLNSAGFKSCITACNVGVRRLLNLPNTIHNWLLGHLLDSVHMTYKLYIRDLQFIYCMKNNDNDLVSSCFEYVSIIMPILFSEIKKHISEKNIGSNMTFRI